MRNILVNFIAKHLFKTITEDELLRRNGRGRLESKGVELSREVEDLIIEQAEGLKQSALWKHLKNDLKHHAIQKSLHESKTMNDVVSGKLLIYIIDVIESRLDNLRKR